MEDVLAALFEGLFEILGLAESPKAALVIFLCILVIVGIVCFFIYL
jgi:hypothetical protein